MRLPVTSRFQDKAPSANIVLAVVCLGVFFGAADQTVIYGALPKIMSDIKLPVTRLDQAAWIVIGYLLGYTFAMPLMGRVSDVYGHRRIYVLSLLIFIVGSLSIALATDLQWIVGARVVQAIGGGAMVPVAMAIAGDVFAERRRAVALGIVGAAAEAGGAVGPFYGAALAQYWSWRWIFWINLPVSLLVMFVVLFFLRATPRAGGKVDYIGGTLIAVGVGFLSLGLSQQSSSHHYLAYLIPLLAISLILFALFGMRITRALDPLFRISLFKNSIFFAANLTNVLVGGALIIAMVNIPLMTDTIMGKTAMEGGLRLLRFTVMLSVGAVAGGFLCKRYGYRVPTVIGLICSTAGLFLMSRWSLAIADPNMTIHLAISGFGFGLVIAPLATAVMNSAGEDQKGIASSLIVTTRLIGMIIGLSAITSWGMNWFHFMTVGMSIADIVTAPSQLLQSILGMFHNFFLAAALIVVIAAVPALWLSSNPQKNHNSVM
jgi:EmrB/QacA subfamily drug resistance transporter